MLSVPVPTEFIAPQPFVASVAPSHAAPGITLLLSRHVLSPVGPVRSGLVGSGSGHVLRRRVHDPCFEAEAGRAVHAQPLGQVAALSAALPAAAAAAASPGLPLARAEQGLERAHAAAPEGPFPRREAARGQP